MNQSEAALENYFGTVTHACGLDVLDRAYSIELQTLFACARARGSGHAHEIETS